MASNNYFNIIIKKIYNIKESILLIYIYEKYVYYKLYKEKYMIQKKLKFINVIYNKINNN